MSLPWQINTLSSPTGITIDRQVIVKTEADFPEPVLAPDGMF